MKKQNRAWIFLVALLIFVAVKWSDFLGPATQRAGISDSYRNTNGLVLTKHVKCRMGCRGVTLEEIREIIENGVLNPAKSGVGTKGDSTFALEGISADSQHLRVVVAPKKDGRLVVITCIDLEKEWPCNCD